jgi:GNAT superfamily N-acetyltransferase
VNKYLHDALTLPGDARQAWRTDGAPGIWSEIAERTVYRVARRGRYDLYDRDLAAVQVIEPPPDIEVRLLDSSEHPMLTGLMTRRRRAQLDRVGPPRTIFAALRSGRVVGYSWWTHEIDALVSFAPLVLPDNAVFHGFVHVDRAVRHQRVASALFSAGERHLADQGAQLCWFLSRTANVEGARNARARWVGKSRHIARLTYWKLPFRTIRRLTLVDPV